MTKTPVDNETEEQKQNTSISLDEIVKKSTNKNIADALDDVFILSGLGSKTNAAGNYFYGLNHRQTPTLVPHNSDQNGYAFFTRPRLNLTESNIMTCRKLNNLLNSNPMSIGRIVRNTLDPVLAKNVKKYPCPFIDPNNVFIPLLSNGLITMDPPPSTTMGVYSSNPGVYKEVFSMADDIVIDHSTYNINCTFRNTQGNPYLTLFYSWMLYTSLQYLDEGPIPYPDDMKNNRMNYTTRIYRIITDPSKRFVQHIWACLYAFPITIETGSIFSFDINKPIKDELKILSVQFQCVGSYFNDPLLINQFNTSVGLLNGLMKNERRQNMMVKIPHNLLKVYNNMGYPRINPDNMELEWWITKDQFNSSKENSTYLQNINKNVFKG